jgi:site-specific recombinase XerC
MSNVTQRTFTFNRCYFKQLLSTTTLCHQYGHVMMTELTWRNPMSQKHKMKSSVINVVKYNKNGSYRTQNDRLKSLLHTTETLHQLGYKMDSLQQMKQKHLYALVKYWQETNISQASMKNRMSHLRWLLDKWHKADMVPSNDALGIPKRVYINDKNRAWQLTQLHKANMTNALMWHSLQAQQLFGLRVEESLKIKPYVADKGDCLYLVGSWTKGGRDRYIPIHSKAQRQWLDEAKLLVSHRNASLIPDDARYITYRNRFEKACERAAIRNKHGLRYYYAQQRYKELTGWDCSLLGGPTRNAMNTEQKATDEAARAHLSAAMGHRRISILTTYIGR